MRCITIYDFVYDKSMAISRPKDDAVLEADKWMLVEIAIVRLDHEVTSFRNTEDDGDCHD